MIVENIKSGNRSDGVKELQEKTIKPIEYLTQKEAKEKMNVVDKNSILESG